MILSLNKKLFLVFLICTFIACVIRWFFFERFGTFSNDDLSYVGIAKHIFIGFPTVDGYKPHTTFPPGYPFILALENLVLKDLLQVREYEYIILTGIIPFIILAFFQPLNIKFSLPHASLLCFTPLFLYFTATLGGATEIWFTIFTFSGVYLILKFHISKRILFLFFGNFLFSFSYIIRPEGLAYFFTSIISIFFFFKSSQSNCNRVVVFKIILSFLIPIFLFIAPYVLFLYKSIGLITISGKSTANQELVNSIFTSQSEKLISNTVSLFRSLVAPFFLGPIILFFLAIFSVGLILKTITFQKNYLLLIAPFPVIILAMLNFLPWARALISTVPILLIFSSKGLDFLISKINFKYSSIIIFCLLTIIQIGITFTPLILGKFDNNPKQYYEIFSNLNTSSRPYTLFSRDKTLQLLTHNLEVCSEIGKCSQGLDYAILSNSTHNKLTKISDFENQEIPPIYFSYQTNQCTIIRSNNRGVTWFAAYKCHKNQSS